MPFMVGKIFGPYHYPDQEGETHYLNNGAISSEVTHGRVQLVMQQL